MNAARLEEIARIAEAITTDGYDPSLNADIRDLARCARAWAKVDARCCSLGPLLIKSAWQHVDHDGRVRYGPTALEAVEAAEVKP